MHSLLFGENFLSSAKKLERKLQIRLKKSLDILQINPFHPILHTKPLQGKLTGFYSFRIGRDYRVIFQFAKEKQVIILLRVKPRDKVYR